jgi:hypothetical protein
MVVGPTNESPFPLSALLSPIDSSDVVVTSAIVLGFFGAFASSLRFAGIYALFDWS